MTDTNKNGGADAMSAAELLAALDKTHAWATEASDESRNEDGDGTREYDNDMRRFHEARAAVAALIKREAALQDWRFHLCERLGLSCAAGAEWSVDDVLQCVLGAEKKLIAERDAMAKRIAELEERNREMTREFEYLRDCRRELPAQDRERWSALARAEARNG